MVTQKVIVRNRLGLHARPASKLVRIAALGQSRVTLIRNSKKVNARSILGVMLLEAEPGAELWIEVEGADEDMVLEQIISLFNRKFDEE